MDLITYTSLSAGLQTPSLACRLLSQRREQPLPTTLMHMHESWEE